MLTKLLKSLSKLVSDSRKPSQSITGNEPSEIYEGASYPKRTAEEFFARCGNNFCEMNFKDFKGWCRVLSIYDGDTITVGIP